MPDVEHHQQDREALDRIGDNRRAFLVGDIHTLHNKLKKSSVEMAEETLAIGRHLIELRESLGHGNWLAFVHKELPFTERVAQYYMKLAKSGAKSELISYLGIRGALAATNSYLKKTERRPFRNRSPSKRTSKFDTSFKVGEYIDTAIEKEGASGDQSDGIIDPSSHKWLRPKDDEVLLVEWQTPSNVSQFAYVWCSDKGEYNWVFLQFINEWTNWKRTEFDANIDDDGHKWQEVVELLKHWTVIVNPSEQPKIEIEETYYFNDMSQHIFRHFGMLASAEIYYHPRRDRKPVDDDETGVQSETAAPRRPRRQEAPPDDDDQN